MVLKFNSSQIGEYYFTLKEKSIMNIIDLLVFVLCAVLTNLAWKAFTMKNVSIALRNLAFVCLVLTMYLLPTGYSKDFNTWEQLPQNAYVVPTNISYNDWKSAKIATAYRTNREILYDYTDMVIVYNPEYMSVEEARTYYIDHVSSR